MFSLYDSVTSARVQHALDVGLYGLIMQKTKINKHCSLCLALNDSEQFINMLDFDMNSSVIVVMFVMGKSEM